MCGFICMDFFRQRLAEFKVDWKASLFQQETAFLYKFFFFFWFLLRITNRNKKEKSKKTDSVRGILTVNLKQATHTKHYKSSTKTQRNVMRYMYKTKRKFTNFQVLTRRFVLA